jgi:hypothetical protein
MKRTAKGPSPRGSNWKEDYSKDTWAWSGDGYRFEVRGEEKGADVGITDRLAPSIYRLHMMTPDGRWVKRKRTVTTPEDAFGEASTLWQAAQAGMDPLEIGSGNWVGSRKASTLRSKLIRLAHEKPELRKDLVPLLKTGGKSFSYKERAPKKISDAMSWWRQGFGPMPKSYIEWHKGLAEKHFKTLVRDYNLKVTKKGMRRDGWGDGMQVFTAEVETPSGNEVTLVWHDSSTLGGQWMVDTGHGRGALHESELT